MKTNCSQKEGFNFYNEEEQLAAEYIGEFGMFDGGGLVLSWK